MKTYNRPQADKVKLDNEIALIMMTPPGDPPAKRDTPSFGENENGQNDQEPFMT